MNFRTCLIAVVWVICLLVIACLHGAPAPLSRNRPQMQPHPVGVWRGQDPSPHGVGSFHIEFHPGGRYCQVCLGDGHRMWGEWRRKPSCPSIVQVCWDQDRKQYEDEYLWWRDNWHVTPGVIWWPYSESGSLLRIGDLP